MSDDNYGACVVAIPYPVEYSGDIEGGAHVTLAYLGDTALPEDLLLEIKSIVAEVASEVPESFRSDTLGFEEFGEDGEAVVITLDPEEQNPLVDIRERILGEFSEKLTQVFLAAETWPDYRPHLTLGYKNEGYELPSDAKLPEFLEFYALAVWNGGQRDNFFIEEPVIKHYGTPRKSGRYPWGSGANPNQRNKELLDYVDDLRRKGLTEKQIAEGMGMSTTELRARKAIAKNEQRKADAAMALKLKDKGLSNVAIGERMGINESSVRALLNPAMQERQDILVNTSKALKDRVDETGGFVDIGSGVERHLGISQTKLNTAVAMLKEEGYEVVNVQVDQLGTGKKTTVKVLAPPGTTYRDVVTNTEKINTIGVYSEDGGRTLLGISETPRSVSSKRIEVRYAEQGGTDKDGVIELRRGVDDISLGNARYAQVRIAVDGTHYLKGMAMYSDDLPPGVDIRFNTNKSNTGNKLDAMKGLKDDEDRPFGSTVRQKHYVDKDGKQQLSALNIVNEEGAWHNWSRNLSSQMLSKQSPSLAKEQLGLSYDIRKGEFDEIMGLTNPVVKKKLLEKFADGADAAAVHLKAAGLPRTRNHVILPIPDLPEGEIYAPNYRNGERVVLIRHPHGGKFEIPELVVNNRHPASKKALGGAIDAVGINPRVAERLSGADFDGDTVLVIPNNKRSVKNEPALQGLKNFDPQSYKLPKDAPKMSARTKQRQMGDVSNLITDMTIKGASNSEIARAVRHSMVVIDAEKHHLDYKRSAQDNGIADLKRKYQNGARSGASTLISQASSDVRVPDRKLRRATEGGPVDKNTGKLVYVPTGEGYTNAKGQFVPRMVKSKKMAEVDDARKLSSGTPMEEVYASHANKMKALANSARKAAIETPPVAWSPSAKKAYAPEVASLNAKLNVALKNAPLERRAQLLANTTVKAKTQANPDMGSDEVKKIKGQALQAARDRVGAGKTRIDITPSEWAAIQAGAISNNQLNKILDNADLDRVKQLATPRPDRAISSPMMARAKSMLNMGYDQAEIADALGVPASTLNDALLTERKG